MEGLSDIGQPFGELDPQLRPGEFVFVDGEVPAAGFIPPAEIQASVREAEGLSLVVSREVADREGLDYGFVAAWIELGLHSELEMVGLTALISSRLSEAGISCNLIAGLRHDHLLVPVEKADSAVERLR